MAPLSAAGLSPTSLDKDFHLVFFPLKSPAPPSFPSHPMGLLCVSLRSQQCSGEPPHLHTWTTSVPVAACPPARPAPVHVPPRFSTVASPHTLSPRRHSSSPSPTPGPPFPPPVPGVHHSWMHTDMPLCLPPHLPFTVKVLESPLLAAPTCPPAPTRLAAHITTAQRP